MRHASAQIAAHVLASLGMHASALEEGHLQRAIRRRMRAAGLSTTAAYVEHYRSSPTEQALLAEELYIRETYFFRDRAVFDEALRWSQRWLAEHDEPIRIISAPCSTGEEPYSIAAMLRQAGVPRDRFVLNALDVSEHALSQARHGVYRGLSLRNVPDPGRESFLHKESDGWHVVQEVREAVRFRQANLLHPGAIGFAAYDLIFCRNLLLYLDGVSRQRVARNLAEALRPGGRVVLGSADWSRDLEPWFRLEEPAHSFAMRAVVTPEPEELMPQEEVPEKPAAPVQADDAREEDLDTVYARAFAAMRDGNPVLGERLCRQVLYMDKDYLPALELLSRIWKRHASHRLNRALDARLTRNRALAVKEQG